MRKGNTVARCVNVLIESDTVKEQSRQKRERKDVFSQQYDRREYSCCKFDSEKNDSQDVFLIEDLTGINQRRTDR